MPIVRRQGTLMPPQARTSDVARDMVERITPIQQQKMQAAFRVQGIDGILYTALQSGKPCQCKSPKKSIAKLTRDGLATNGIMNEILTNQTFGGIEYNDAIIQQRKNTTLSAEAHPSNAFQYVGSENSTANQLSAINEIAGDNGYFNPVNDMDDLVKGFDYDLIGYSDVACAICFGNAYVGGYTALRTWRRAFQLADMHFHGQINTIPYVWTLEPEPVTLHTVLPKGACSVDSCRVLNNNKAVRSKVFVDGDEITSDLQLLSYCDGLQHDITFEPTDEITHAEIQFALTHEQMYFEIPKLSRGSDLSYLERTEAFEIFLSPDVPHLNTRDVIVESQLGKALIVNNVSPWQTKMRRGLGFQCQVRVTEQMEMYSILPSRGKIFEAKTINMVRNSRRRSSSGLNSNYFNSTI